MCASKESLDVCVKGVIGCVRLRSHWMCVSKETLDVCVEDVIGCVR